MLRLFPLLLVAVILYSLVAFGAPLAGHPDMTALLAHGVTVKLESGEPWRITAGDAMVMFSFALLFADLVKGARASPRAFVGHALAILTFGIALGEFILLKGFATSAFFFVTLMTLFDAGAGMAISAAERGEEEFVEGPNGHRDAARTREP